MYRVEVVRDVKEKEKEKLVGSGSIKYVGVPYRRAC